MKVPPHVTTPCSGCHKARFLYRIVFSVPSTLESPSAWPLRGPAMLKGPVLSIGGRI